MAGIRLVDCQDVQHPAVVLLEIALHPPCFPIARRRADGVDAGGFRIQRRRGVQIRRRVAALKLGHLDDLAKVRVRQAQDIVGANELLDVRDTLLRIGDQRLRLAVLAVVMGQHAMDRLAAAFGIIGRQRHAWERRAPELPGDHIHVAHDTRELRQSFVQHLGRRETGVQLELHLSFKAFLAQPPFALRAGKQVLFEKLLIVPEHGQDLLGDGLDLAKLRRLAGHFVDVALIERDGAPVLTNGRLNENARRIASGSPSPRPRYAECTPSGPRRS